MASAWWMGHHADPSAEEVRDGARWRVSSIELARALRAAGLQWRPARGDVFVMPDRGMVGADVFVLSDMRVFG